MLLFLLFLYFLKDLDTYFNYLSPNCCVWLKLEFVTDSAAEMGRGWTGATHRKWQVTLKADNDLWLTRSQTLKTPPPDIWVMSIYNILCSCNHCGEKIPSMHRNNFHCFWTATVCDTAGGKQARFCQTGFRMVRNLRKKVALQHKA